MRPPKAIRRAVFLDRDGVINQAIVINGKPHPPANLQALEILPGVASALQSLSAAGFLLIVITNQPDVARGITPKAQVETINQYLATTLPIDEFRTCFHDDNDNCLCRKPMPGGLLAAAKTHHIDLNNSFMIGDRWRDIEAGERAGCRTIFINYDYDEKQPLSMNYTVKTLTEAAQIILKQD